MFHITVPHNRKICFAHIYFFLQKLIGDFIPTKTDSLTRFKDLKWFAKNAYIDPSDIPKGNQLGSGQFGQVTLGEIKSKVNEFLNISFLANIE